MDTPGRSPVFLVLKLFFSPMGRIRPSLYWAGMGALSLLALAVSAGFGMLKGPVFVVALSVWSAMVLHTPGPGFVVQWTVAGPETVGTSLSAAIVCAFCLVAFCLQAKRLHDADQSAWWVIFFALFQMLAPLPLGLLTRALFKPEDANGFVFAVGANMVLGMVLPLVFKLWIGLAASRPEANLHGPQPGPREIGLPPGGARLSLFRPRG